jgi:hypothetical protein
LSTFAQTSLFGEIWKLGEKMPIKRVDGFEGHKKMWYLRRHQFSSKGRKNLIFLILLHVQTMHSLDKYL